jgi:hypothetical protein
MCSANSSSNRPNDRCPSPVVALKPATADRLRVRTAADIDPSHVLVLGSVDQSDPEALVSCHAATAYALQHGDAVDVFLDADHIAAVSHAALGELGESFTLVSNGQYRGELPEASQLIVALLDVDDRADLAAIERIVIRREEWPLLSYHLESLTVDLDADRADGVVDDVREGIDEYPAALLETTPLVRWRQDGHEYALDPPALRVDDTGFPLSSLASIWLDRDRRQVQLAWNASDRGLLSRLASRFGPSRPTTLTFTDSAQFQRVAREFESLGETLVLMPENDRLGP